MQEPNYAIMKEMAEKYSTVPLIRGWKRPVLKNWEQGATTRWITTEIARGQNLGIICGPASVSVLDVDQPDKFRFLAEIHGFKWEDHFVVKTPNKGGFHIYFKFNQAMADYFKVTRLNVTAGRTGCELMLNGCYVVAPGSYLTKDPDSKKPVYDHYKIIHNGPVAEELPDWLMKIIIAEFVDMVALRKKTDRRTENEAWKTEPWTPDRCWDNCKMAFKLAEGKRNDIVYWFAKILHQHGNGLECVPEVAGWIDEVTDASFSYSEAVRTLTARINRLTA